ncbi:metal ABC transporter permease, partial [Streptomyces sp. SID11233]|nr:metal ABC transporter permease [Streptomyces sp. SID11233]
MDMLQSALMQRALLAAVLVGITAPAIGIYLVQRRQALMGDGIGHVA